MGKKWHIIKKNNYKICKLKILLKNYKMISYNNIKYIFHK